MPEVEAISAEWDDLLSRTTAPEIFRTYLWAKSWWEVFGGTGGRQPFVVGVRQGKTLVGLAPLLTRPVGGLFRQQRLEFFGTGEDEADEICSDFLDIMAAAGFEDQVVRAIWNAIEAERPRWDEAVFRNIVPGSLLSRFFQPMARDAGCADARRPSGERFYVNLDAGDFNAYTDGLSKKKKKRIFYYRRRMEKEGGFVERRIERKEEIPLFLAEIARLSRMRRGSQGMSTAWQSEKFRRFHAVAAPRLWDAGQLDLRLWQRGDTAVAALYNFLYDGTIYYYQSGFDTQAFGNTSPGLVTISHVIEWGFVHKMRRYDFLVGAEGSYKEDYNCETEVASDLTLYNETPRAYLLRSAHAVRGFLGRARMRAEAAKAAEAHAHEGQPTGPRLETGPGEGGGGRGEDDETELRSV